MSILTHFGDEWYKNHSDLSNREEVYRNRLYFRLHLMVCGILSSQKWKPLSRVGLFATPWTIQFMEFSRPEYCSGYPFPSPGYLPNPGIKPRSPTLQVDSLPAEPQEKPKNTGVGSLSLLQQIFPTQESNQGLLHCRWILYQLNFQGSPMPLQTYM